MKNSVKLMTSALALGFAMSGFAQDATHTSQAAPKETAKLKVIIELPKQAIESGKIIIRDGQVYARIGKADKMADGRSVAELDILLLSTASPTSHSVIISRSRGSPGHFCIFPPTYSGPWSCP